MSVFEFILIPFAIIIGFGISEILENWGEQIRGRHRRRPHPLQIVSSVFVLAACMIYLWMLWWVGAIEWTVPRYFVVAVPALAFALAAHVSRIDTSVDAPPALEQYFQNCRPLYLLLSLLPLAGIVGSFAPVIRDQFPDAPDLALITTYRVVAFAVFLSMGWIKTVRWHAFGLCFFFFSMFGILACAGADRFDGAP